MGSLKGTVSVKMAMPGLQQYHWKICLIKYELDINVFFLFELFIFICGFSAESL